MKKFAFILVFEDGHQGFCDDYDTYEDAERDMKYYAAKEHPQSTEVFSY